MPARIETEAVKRNFRHLDKAKKEGFPAGELEAVDQMQENNENVALGQ